VTVDVSGEVDLSTVPVVETAIDEAVEADAVTAVEVDLGAVRFIDSSGIALLVRGHHRATARGVAYRVRGAHGVALQVLQLTGVWPYLSGEAGPPGPA
jgi:anti-anti-sigma factor